MVTKMPRQRILRQNPFKIPLSLFYVGIYYWAQRLLLSMVCIPSETPLEKNNISFVSDVQLEIASGLGMGACDYFSQL